MSQEGPGESSCQFPRSPGRGRLNNTVVCVRYKQQKVSSFYIFNKRQKTIYRYQSKAYIKKKHSPLPPCFVSFVWSLLCTQFNVQFVFNVQYHKNSTFDRQHKLKQRFKQGLCCCCCCFLFEVSSFFQYYFTWLICLEMPLLNMQRLIILSDKYLEKSIHETHSTSDLSV